METVFYQLIEEQTKNMMLTQVKAEYVLKTIDPAQVPEKKGCSKTSFDSCVRNNAWWYVIGNFSAN
jgi:hypothetical protein